MSLRHIVYLSCVLLLLACDRPDDEQQIRDAIERMAQAVEEHRPKDVVADVAEQFIGPSPRVDRDYVRNTAREMMLRNETIRVVITSIDVQLHSQDRADAVVNTVLAGGGSFLPERGRQVEFSTTWRKIDGDWQVVRADWDQSVGF